MLPEIQSALRASISETARRVGPFLIHFDEADDHPFRNYAIPDDGARPTTADVSELVAAFTGRARRPRLEYVSPAPAVDAALEAAGFTVDLRLPLMTLPAGGLRPPAAAADVTLTVATGEADLRSAASVQNAAYAGDATVTEADLERLRATNAGGGAVVLARCQGAPAGAGLYPPPRGGLAQLAGVAVLPEFRRRGIASLVGAELTRLALDAGATPYLETETHNENRLYGRLGYRTIGELVAISLTRGEIA